MAARESQHMEDARRLILAGELSPRAAAHACGLTKNAVYMAPWYKAWIKAGKPLTPTQGVRK